MVEQTFGTWCKATEAAIQTQQEVFKKWVGLKPGALSFPGGLGDLAKYQKKSVQIVGELLKKQCESVQAQLNAGLSNIEEAYQLVETKDPEDFRKKTVALWQKTFDFLRETYVGQVRDLQTFVTKYNELITKPAAAGQATGPD